MNPATGTISWKTSASSGASRKTSAASSFRDLLRRPPGNFGKPRSDIGGKVAKLGAARRLER